MPAARRSSSNRAIAAFALAAVASIGGCAGQRSLLPQLGGDEGLRLTTITEETAAAPAEAAKVPTPRVEPVADTRADDDIIYIQQASQASAWCEYLREDSAAEATIMRAPTLSGQVDDEGRGSINLGVSMSSMRKAALTERSAEARCRRHIAEAGLQKIAFVASIDLTASGLRAKAQTIRRYDAEFNRLRKRIAAVLDDGAMTADKAASLRVMIDQMIAGAAQAQAEAERRSRDGLVMPKGTKALSEAYLTAEADLQDLAREMRDADAFDVSVSAGYSESDMSDGFEPIGDGLNGKITFSMKLGAFVPQRSEHEAKARAARLKAARNGEGSVLWQIEILRKSYAKAISGLEATRGNLDRALAEARRLTNSFKGVNEPELAAASIQAQLQVIQIEAERAGVHSSINEIRQQIAKLSRLDPKG